MRDMTEPAAAGAVTDRQTAMSVEFAHDAVQLLRTTQAIQYQLSQMADQKASMLLGITFVIFTLVVGQARMSATTPPLLILGGAAFLAAFLTVLAVMPSTGSGEKDGSGANILFFGVYTRMTQDAFTEALVARLADSKSLYETFAHDIYQNGKVLAQKKYRLLGYAYRVLLVGLVASLVAFVAPYAMKLVGV